MDGVPTAPPPALSGFNFEERTTIGTWRTSFQNVITDLNQARPRRTRARAARAHAATRALATQVSEFKAELLATIEAILHRVRDDRPLSSKLKLLKKALDRPLSRKVSDFCDLLSRNPIDMLESRLLSHLKRRRRDEAAIAKARKALVLAIVSVNNEPAAAAATPP